MGWGGGFRVNGLVGGDRKLASATWWVSSGKIKVRWGLFAKNNKLEEFAASGASEKFTPVI